MAKLEDPIDQEEERLIVKYLWNQDIEEDISQYKSFLEYYAGQTYGMAFWKGSKLAVQTHADIRHIIGIFSKHRNSGMAEIYAVVKQSFPGYTGDVKDSIDLALRLWLAVRRPNTLSLSKSGDDTISRESEPSSLIDFIHRQVPSVSEEVPPAESELDLDFTAHNLVQYCNVTIYWTHSLADHLKFNPVGRELLIYPFKICLYDHQYCNGQAFAEVEPRRPILSNDLIQETLWSLSLLFPWKDRNKNTTILPKRLLRRGGEKKTHTLHTCPPYDYKRNVNDYRHWRGRLVQLQILSRTQPKSLRQALFDKRNTIQLYTLWTAVIVFFLTILFGVISSVTGIMQTKASLASLEVAKQALELQRGSTLIEQGQKDRV